MDVDKLVHKAISALPENMSPVIDKNDTPQDILRKLDELMVRNEQAYARLRRDFFRVKRSEKECTESLKETEDKDERRYTIMEIRRLRGLMETIDRSMRIHDRNMHLHIAITGKISQILSIQLSGMSGRQIDEVMQDFDDCIEEYIDTIHSASAIDTSVSIDSIEEKEIREIESEILKREKPEKVESLDRLQERVDKLVNEPRDDPEDDEKELITE